MIIIIIIIQNNKQLSRYTEYIDPGQRILQKENKRYLITIFFLNKLK